MKNLLFILIFLVSCKKENIQHFQTQKFASTIADPGIDPLGSIQTHIISDVFGKAGEIVTYDNGIVTTITPLRGSPGTFNMLANISGKIIPLIYKEMSFIAYKQCSYQSVTGKDFYSYKMNAQGQTADVVYTDASIELMVATLFPSLTPNQRLERKQCIIRAFERCAKSWVCGFMYVGFMSGAAFGLGWWMACSTGWMH